MNVFLEQEVEPDKRQRSLELLRAAGVGWIRQQLPWEQIEPVAKGQTIDPKFGGSTWAKFDDIVDRANGLGMQVILRLDTSPRWALPPDAPDGLGPPLQRRGLLGLRRPGGDALSRPRGGLPGLERAKSEQRVGPSAARSGWPTRACCAAPSERIRRGRPVRAGA